MGPSVEPCCFARSSQRPVGRQRLLAFPAQVSLAEAQAAGCRPSGQRQVRPTRSGLRTPVHNRFPTHSNLPASARQQGMQCILKSSVIFLTVTKIGDVVDEKPTLARRQAHRDSPGHNQKPSSARPTQLSANIEETSAATEAKVAIVFADRMIRILCRKQSNSVQRSVLHKGENSPRQINQTDCGYVATTRNMLARKNPHLHHVVGESVGI